MRRGWLAALAVVAAGAAAAETVEEPSGYRMDDYRAPVPATLQGGKVVDAAGARALWEAGATAFLDVLPRPPKPANLPEGTIWHEKPRDSIPGAIWLPNVGYGEIAAETADYFRAGLAQATGGDTGHPVLFFCLTDCWMSWNAAKRAIDYGYTDVTWFPGGTDGWAASGYDLVPVQPWSPPGQ